MNLRQIQTSDAYFNEVFSMLASEQKTLAGDAANSHRIDTIDNIKELTYNQVQARHISAGIRFQTPTEVAKDLALKIAGDEFFNPSTGIGTLSDPTVYTRAHIPVMMGPTEMCALYASGGLPSIIIDKKTRGMVAGGITFKTFDDDLFTTDMIKQLEEAAENTGLNEHLTDAIRDCMIMGGSCIYPVFKGESLKNRECRLGDLELQPDCVERWVNVDRWNLVFVPSFIVTAADYLRPETVYLPLGGYAISTTRCALLKPKSMPYWATLYNMGWSPSDFCGYIKALLGYEMITMSVPIMAQQMSLLLCQMPLDAMQATLGVKAVKELMQHNEEQMAQWSILHPKAINMVGEVLTVNRTFSGFDHFVQSVKSDLAAQSGIAEPILFHTPNKGFSDNTQESLLKESEMMKMLQRSIEVQLPAITDALVAHVWGTGSKEWENRSRIQMSFDRPIVSTEKDLAEVGARYAATVASLKTAGVPATEGIKLAQQFFKNVVISDELIAAVKEAEEKEQELAEKSAMSPMGGGGRPGIGPSKGRAVNTGKLTKPTKAK